MHEKKNRKQIVHLTAPENPDWFWSLYYISDSVTGMVL